MTLSVLLVRMICLLDKLLKGNLLNYLRLKLLWMSHTARHTSHSSRYTYSHTSHTARYARMPPTNSHTSHHLSMSTGRYTSPHLGMSHTGSCMTPTRGHYVYNLLSCMSRSLLLAWMTTCLLGWMTTGLLDWMPTGHGLLVWMIIGRLLVTLLVWLLNYVLLASFNILNNHLATVQLQLASIFTHS